LLPDLKSHSLVELARELVIELEKVVQSLPQELKEKEDFKGKYHNSIVDSKVIIIF
jgi:hypothetical protein